MAAHPPRCVTALSKFVILEVVNVVFGDHVELGSFIEVAGIVVVMLGANAAPRALFRLLARLDASPPARP